MATQVDIIRSDRVALRVVRNLKLAENPQVREQWQDETEGGEGSVEQWLIRVFQQKLDVVPTREAASSSISYKAGDPRFAAGWPMPLRRPTSTPRWNCA
jgi:succinoglycan biosynthesis transport protein ExoP